MYGSDGLFDSDEGSSPPKTLTNVKSNSSPNILTVTEPQVEIPASTSLAKKCLNFSLEVPTDSLINLADADGLLTEEDNEEEDKVPVVNLRSKARALHARTSRKVNTTTSGVTIISEVSPPSSKAVQVGTRQFTRS